MKTAFEQISNPDVPVLSVRQVENMIRYAEECRRRVLARGEVPLRIPHEYISPAVPVRQ